MTDPSIAAPVSSQRQNRRKRKRKGRKATPTTLNSLNGPLSMISTLLYDLNVPLPRTQGALTDLMSRLQSAGYGVAAFSHTAYGRPDPKKDAAGVVLQDSVLESSLQASLGVANAAAGSGAGAGGSQKRQRHLGILKRLNAVVEELSDIAYYTDSTTDNSGGSGSSGAGGEVRDVLDSYDVVALSPRSDATFASACSTASRADVIMLDYSTGRLPFKLKGSSIRAAAKLGIAFELCYASAILEPSKRKALVRIALDLHNASRGVRNPSPRIILTSGTRVAAGEDFGTLALRTPSDLVNLLKTVLMFGDIEAMGAMGAMSSDVVTRCRNRKLGLCITPSDGGNNGMKNTVGVNVEGSDDDGGSLPALGTARKRIQELIAAGGTAKQEARETNEGNTSVTKRETDEEEEEIHEQESESESNGSEEGEDGDEDDDDDGFITFS